MDDLHLNNLRETPLTTAARGNVPATSWYLSSVKPEMQLTFKANRLERENKLGLAKKDVLAGTSLVDVSVHNLTKSRHPGAVGGGSIGNGPPRRRMGSLVAQGFGGGNSSEEMMLVPQTNNNINGSGSDVAAMPSVDVFTAAALAGVNSSSSSKSLKAITEVDETAAAGIIDNDNGGDKQGTPSATAADASTGKRKSSFFKFFGLGGNVSGKELPSPSSATNTAVVAAATFATSGPDVEAHVKPTKAAAGRPQSAGKTKSIHKHHRSPPKAGGKNNGQGNDWAIEDLPELANNHAAAAAAAVTNGIELSGPPAGPATMSSVDATPPNATARPGSETQKQPQGLGRVDPISRKGNLKPSRVVLPPLKQQQQKQPQVSLLNEPMPKSLDVAATAAAGEIASGGGRQRSQSIAETSSSSSPQKRQNRSKSEKSQTHIDLGTANPSTKTPKATKSMSEKTKMTTSTINSSGLNQSSKIAPDS